MLSFRDEVSHEWPRRDLLRRYRAGALPRRDLCDAEPLLISAASFHGRPAARPCPVCGGGDLREVHWVHGGRLGARDGSARTDAEIERLVRLVGEFTVHTVEVCPDCRWNHLLRSRVALDADDGAAAGGGG